MKDLFRTLSNFFSTSGADREIHYAPGGPETQSSAEEAQKSAESDEITDEELFGSEEASAAGGEVIAKAMPRLKYDEYVKRSADQAIKGLKFNKRFDVRSYNEDGTTLTGDEIAKAFRKITYTYAELQTEYELVMDDDGKGMTLVSLNVPGLREDKAPKLMKEAGRFLAKNLTPEQLSKAIVMVNEMAKDGRHGRHAMDQYLADMIKPMISHMVNAKAFTTRKERIAVRAEAKQQITSLIDNPTQYSPVPVKAATAVATRERPPRPER